MQQEKSRALEITAERAARRSVLVISRTMPSSRLAMTVITTGSRTSGLRAGLPRADFDTSFGLEVGWGFGPDFAVDFALDLSLAFCLAMAWLAYDFKM